MAEARREAPRMAVRTGWSRPTAFRQERKPLAWGSVLLIEFNFGEDRLLAVRGPGQTTFLHVGPNEEGKCLAGALGVPLYSFEPECQLWEPPLTALEQAYQIAGLFEQDPASHHFAAIA